MQLSARLPRIFGTIATTAAVLFGATFQPVVTHAAADPAALADAYGDLSVFMLNVAAGHDGVPRDPQGEQAFRQFYAQSALNGAVDLRSLDDDSAAQLLALPAALHQGWQTVPSDQRQALHQQWAAAVQSSLDGIPCDVFDAMSRAYLVPTDAQYWDANKARLGQCWEQYPQLARGRDGKDLSDAVRLGAGGSGSSGAYTALMNAETTRYAGSMNAIAIMSGSDTRWTVR